MSRFNVKRESLPAYLQDAIYCIEQLQDLKFNHAEDWTTKNQGWVLCFDGVLFKNEKQTYGEVMYNIKAQFCHNPGSKTVDEDESDFEDLELEDTNKWKIYVK